MNRDELLDLIKSMVKEKAYQHLKDIKKNHPTEKTEESVDDIDSVLFYGFEKKEDDDGKALIQNVIKEAQVNDIPKLTTTEIKGFETSFKKALALIPSSDVSFDMQKNNYSIIAYSQNNSVEVKASGYITFGNRGRVKWSFSILNGIYISTDSLEIDQSNKTITEVVYNYYDSWQNEWREKFSL